MRSSDILVDVGWALERDDLESILHVDRARHDIIASAFKSSGPLRIVTKATLAASGISCSSFEDERIPDGAAELVSYLRHAFIKIFEIDYSVDAKTIRSLVGLKDYFVIDNLYLKTNEIELIDGALDCSTLIWRSWNYTQGDISLEPDCEAYEDYDEHELEELNKRYAFLENFFKLRTVRNAENLHLENIPYMHLKAVSRWLHGDDADQRLSGAKELHAWPYGYQGNELNALIAVLEKRFRSDTESKEYKFVASGEHLCVGASLVQSRKLENNAGDVFEVDVMRTCSSSVTVTCYRGETAKRTSLVQNMDGSKVWEFRTARELEKYLLGHNVYELLARLIANEMICKCGSRMHLRIMRRWWDRDGAIWRCGGNCKNGYGETLHVMPTFHSWFYHFDKHSGAEFILKLVILHLGNGPDPEGVTTREKYRTKWHPQLDELLKHQDANINDPLERLYAAVTRKYPYDGAYVLPVLEYWEY